MSYTPVIPIGVVGLIAVIYMLYILANLSQRLGAVLKMPPYYRSFYVAMGFLSVSVLSRVALSSLALVSPPLLTILTYDAPFIIAMLISVVVAWRYWGWLFKEKLS
jgi:hypothetical protein